MKIPNWNVFVNCANYILVNCVRLENSVNFRICQIETIYVILKPLLSICVDIFSKLRKVLYNVYLNFYCVYPFIVRFQNSHNCYIYTISAFYQHKGELSVIYLFLFLIEMLWNRSEHCIDSTDNPRQAWF